MAIKFSSIPPIDISVEMLVQATEDVKDILESVRVNSEGIFVIFSDELVENKSIDKECVLVKWNVLPNVHQLKGPENFPLESLPLCSVDVLELMATKLNLDIILMKDPKIGNYFDFYVGHKLPFAVRKSNKSIYKHIYRLEEVSGQLLSSIMSYSEDYDEFINNAIKTFKGNILEPTLKTISDLPIYKEDNDKWKTESIPIVYEDLARIGTQTDWLIQILESQVENIRERYRALMRIVLPVIQRRGMMNRLKKYVDFRITTKGMNLKVTHKKYIKGENIGNVIIEHLSTVYQ